MTPRAKVCNDLFRTILFTKGKNVNEVIEFQDFIIRKKIHITLIIVNIHNARSMYKIQK